VNIIRHRVSYFYSWASLLISAIAELLPIGQSKTLLLLSIVVISFLSLFFIVFIIAIHIAFGVPSLKNLCFSLA
jgi:hypothetical protein